MAKKAKKEKKAKRDKKEGDSLKLYTTVMGVLVLFMGGLYFYINGVREDYAAGNVRLEALMTGKGLPLTFDDRPQTIPALALEVEKYSLTYAEAGTDELTIPAQYMNNLITRSKLRQIRAGQEVRTGGGGGSYMTVSQDFELDSMTGGPVALWQLLHLVHAVEAQRWRYKVSELRWRVADENDNAQRPYDKIRSPLITVAIRGAIREQ